MKFFFLGLLFLTSSVVAAEDAMVTLVRGYCVSCHQGDEPKGQLRLDHLADQLYNDSDSLERIIGVLAENEMPPRKSKQPPEELRRKSIAHLKAKLTQQSQPARLKRLTRSEYTNTINDLFAADFELEGLLPEEMSREGFNKWGELQPMSPYQVESYLRTARFVADRLILDEMPQQQAWEFTIDHFRGTGRGDFQTDTEHVLTTHYPWRSILYFVSKADEEPIFRVPQYGRYWIQADVRAHFSDRAESVSLSTGDPRFPTNVKKASRAVLPPRGTGLFWDVTLREGTHLSFTYDSAATWNTGSKAEEYRGRQLRFTKVRITGPITQQWPTQAARTVFDGSRFQSLKKDETREFVEHVAQRLINRPLPEDDAVALAELTARRLDTTGSPEAAARTLLTALLSSPHIVYKHASESLDKIELAYRLSYFLWNSVPDSKLLQAARRDELGSRDGLDQQVERMLSDPRSDRFCHDFTRQWLSTDKIDDIGPDDRVHDKQRVTFMKVRELAKEPSAFFREILHHNESLLNFIDSDFAMVNDETSEFYGFGRVQGRDFQRVRIPQESERGGLIGQAGLLKLTSTKHATSPILRGTWVIKKIYGEQLNPPPGLVVEEPDIRAAETVKEVLTLHKSNESCNRCHARIDPFGLALEHYDEMGLRRSEYRHVETKVGDKKIRIRKAPIDSTATLPDGRQISSMADLKAVMMEDREQVVKGILSKLASYALGREIGIADEEMIAEIYDEIADADFSLRAAIHAIVGHRSFGRR